MSSMFHIFLHTFTCFTSHAYEGNIHGILAFIYQKDTFPTPMGISIFDELFITMKQLSIEK
ncbi:hypothetical protein KSC_044450 [Ktedonobacter sp. SOSP1-52]|nr:hypothetical protein KSC_044450 [Ktedonobacter sp. SOSP1-52]